LTKNNFWGILITEMNNRNNNSGVTFGRLAIKQPTDKIGHLELGLLPTTLASQDLAILTGLNPFVDLGIHSL